MSCCLDRSMFRHKCTLARSRFLETLPVDLPTGRQILDLKARSTVDLHVYVVQRRKRRE